MKLLVIDDHPIVLDGLAALLAGMKPDAVVLTARDAHEGFKLLDGHADLDVVLLDLRLPGLNGHDPIAASLNLAEKTVKIHVSAIFRALNVINRTQAAAVGRETGLI